MKVVIIGGGIAGLTLGVFLRQRNFEVVINERSVGKDLKGHAFLMHGDGLSVLNELTTNETATLPYKLVTTYNLRRPEGMELKRIQLESWQCIKRRSMICFLYSLLPESIIKEGREFAHFLYVKGKAIAAVFTNGEIEYGDIFVGADGGRSKVREQLFGKVNFSPVRVKEIVGVTNNAAIAKTHVKLFTKFQHREKGLAFGFIPTSDTEFVWFMQYDPLLGDLKVNNAASIRKFCMNSLKDFPQVVHKLLEFNDFSTSYIWNTTDFDLLPSFHKQNVVLIGDAAHLALPFTSAGTTNAIVDAKTLADSLHKYKDCRQAFNKYYDVRSAEVGQHTSLGRELQEIFLNPQCKTDDDIPVPLIKRKKTDEIKKQIQILYFTDPICSTCWIIQPLLRKLKLEYGNYVNIEYRMGGLLPSWEAYTKGKIKKPSDAARHWEEVCLMHEMPLDGDIWMEDPLNSSYPPSIAFKAAQIQDTDLAILFLRRIKEMVFVEKKNIIKWNFIEKAAFEVGLDSARLLRDFEGRAEELFAEDLILAQHLEVTSFPTLFFTDSLNNRYTLKGYQPYEKFEEIIHQINPKIKKEKINADPENLFAHFSTMADHEFAYLSNISKESASQVLKTMFENGDIEKYESKNGVMWKSRCNTCVVA